MIIYFYCERVQIVGGKLNVKNTLGLEGRKAKCVTLNGAACICVIFFSTTKVSLF